MEERNSSKSQKTVVDLSTVDNISRNLEHLCSTDQKGVNEESSGGGAKKKIPVGVWRSKKSKKVTGTSSSEKDGPMTLEAVNGKSPSQKSPGKRHKQKLSASDPSWEKTHLQKGYMSMPFKNGGCRGMHPSSSSTSSQSSGNFRVPHRERRNSDSQPDEGTLLPHGLRAQHAAHRCAWSESDSGSTTSPGYVTLTRRSADELLDIRESVCTSSFCATPILETKRGSHGGGRPSFRRQLSKPGKREARFDMYMPLCEVQQGLKKGEVIEGVLRINPRNYEDAYISAPDGQMDIYVGGTRDRNRALNGDVVAVKLNDPHEWKVLWDAIRDYEELHGHSLFSAGEQKSSPEFSKIVEDDEDDVQSDTEDPAEESQTGNQESSNGWDAPIGHWEPHTIEILGFDQFQNQVNQYREHRREERSKKRKKRNKKQPQKDVRNQTKSSQTKLSDMEIVHEKLINFCSPSPFEMPPTLEQSHFGGENSNCSTVKNEVDSASSHRLKDIPNDSASSTKTVCGDIHAISVPLSANRSSSDDVVHNVVSDGQAVISNPCDVASNSSSSLLMNSDCSSKPSANNAETKDSNENCDSWGNNNNNASSVSLVVSPEDLIDLGQYTSPFDEGGSSSEIEDDGAADGGKIGVAVPLEDLSEEEYTESVSGESICSHRLDDLIEDVAFLASQQDAANNNTSETDIRTVNEDVAQALNRSDVSNDDDGDVNNVCSDETDNLVNNDVKSDLFGGGISNTSSSYHGVEKKHSLTHLLSEQSSFQPSASPVVPEHAECDNKDANHVVNSDFANAASSNAFPATNSSFDVYQAEISDAFSALVVGETADASLQNGKSSAKKKQRKKKKKKQQKSPKEENYCVPEEDENNFAVGIPQVCSAITEPGSLTVEEIMKHPLGRKFVQKTGKVVHILEQKHTRIAVGHLKPMQDMNPNWALFSPNDHRLPRIMIPMDECPQGFYDRPQDFARSLFICKIVKWDEMSTFARGSLMRSLGDPGDVEVESEAMLIEYGIDFSEFPDEALQGLPLSDCEKFTMDNVTVAREFRRDFRSECVFTIDPATARDLDDALSCNWRDDGMLEVGVHIADVSYFVHEGSALDGIAADRATSVYLVQKVIPMLPRILCEKLCSLNPGEDKLTVSVVWTMDKDANIVDSWCGRSIIRSCAKLSYEHAQEMIENPKKEWMPNEHPPLFGDYGISDIVKRVLQLHALALQLRQRRFDEGALRLDQIKLQFTLNKDNGLPSGFSVFEQKDSHRLVEEFMLLANMHVAHMIYKAFPKKAMLRLHPPPQAKLMEDVVTMCSTMGIHLDANTAGTLQASLAHYAGPDFYSQARTLVLTALCAKPMNRALYFCAGCIDDPAMYRHYALNVPLYTHFTSPIRRYADVIVHRMLMAALGIGKEPKLSPKEIHKQASHCNDKKYLSKQISELSSEMFLGAFIKECGPLEEMAMVMGVMDHSFDVLLLRLGVVKRVYIDNIPVKKADFKRHRGVPQLLLHWEDGRKELIAIFSLVKVVVSSVPDDPLKFTAMLRGTA